MALEPVLERILGPNYLSYEITLTHTIFIFKLMLKASENFEYLKLQ